MIRSKLVGAIVVVFTLTLGSEALASPDVDGFSSPSVLRVLIDQRDSNVLYAATCRPGLRSMTDSPISM